MPVMMYKGIPYGEGTNTLDGLKDVDISNPSTGDVLKYDSSIGKFVNGVGGSSATVLTKTLTAGSTSVTFTDPKLTDGSRTSIYTSNGVGPLYFDDSVDGELTLYFSATINDVGVEVVVE